jgi:predicted ArsR family transcriptional regulator
VTSLSVEQPAAPSTQVHRALSEPSRLRLLEVLREAEHPLDVRELGRRVGLHANTVRSHLTILAEAGLVSTTREQRTRPGRPPVLYQAATDALEADALAYRLLAEILISHLADSEPDPSPRAERAGRAWGAHLIGRPPPFTSISNQDTVDQVVHLHERLGFRPELKQATNGNEIVLKRCPFHQTATSYQSVVCPLHLGLIRGALAELGGGVEADSLQPFARHGACVAHLSAA